MIRCIAFFDVVGYKHLVLSNEHTRLREYVSFIIRDIERSLSKDVMKEWDGGRYIYANTALAKTNVHFISDSIVFWSNTNSSEDVWDCFLTACFFNTLMNLGNLPVRGSIQLGELSVAQVHQKLSDQSMMTIASPYGKGLVESYSMAEDQNWFATRVSDDVISALALLQPDYESYCMRTKFPNKRNEFLAESVVLKYRFPNCGYGGSFEHESKQLLTTVSQLIDDGDKRSREKLNNTMDLLLMQSESSN